MRPLPAPAGPRLGRVVVEGHAVEAQAGEAQAVEAEVAALAQQIAALGEGERTRVFRMSWWTDRMMTWAMADDAFKTQLFRFVDVFPAMGDSHDVRRHVEEYFAGPEVPRAMRAAIAVSRPLPDALTASLARRNITRMARQFIIGTTPEEAAGHLHALWDAGSASTVDVLGEKVVTDAEADRYAARVASLLRTLVDASAQWAPRPLLDHDDLGPLPRASISIKPTALAPSYAALTREAGLAQARGRLLPILRTAAERGASVCIDMEHCDVKDLTLDLLADLATDPELADLDLGIVIQAYLRDAHDDLARVIELSRSRRHPLLVRLVKGAYWDAETVEARAEGWPVPVFLEKAATDASYERCTRLLHDHHGTVRAAFASHNLRSLAYAVAEARRRGIPDDGFELQMLYGMAEPVQAAIRRLGLRLRVYAPMGELLPGMAYLVRRLLENTSNDSFVRQRFAEGRALEELVRAPVVTGDVQAGGEAPGEGLPNRDATRASAPGLYEPEPPAEWRRTPPRRRFETALGATPFNGVVPAVIGGERVRTARTIASVDPAEPSRLVATSASCGRAEADDAMAAAVTAAEGWRRTPAEERAAVLFRAAAWMRGRRDDIAALEVFEAGKPWREADADVCEAIDFCEYYGREALRLAHGGRVDSPPGETNALQYQGKGVGVVIAPWNFPLAIPTGMVTAALVTGNAVVLKPAEQTPAVAYRLVEALEVAGLPPGVLGFLPGPGEEVGAHLVTHRDTAFIIFTGSKAVGLEINRVASVPVDGQRQVKRVVAEMGGKNALVVDADADLDQAAPAIVSSAFSFSGQKCSAASRVVVVGASHDQLVERLVGAGRLLRIGHPSAMSTQVGPVIDDDAFHRIRGLVEDARRAGEGEVALERTDLPEHGWFVGPTIFVGASAQSRLAREEVFGPVLTVLRADSFEEAVAIANDTDYALTAGVFSRSPRNIALAARELRAGNVYVNRGTTGAVVGRQPFGGYGLSGVGSKAGGPDYLSQFVDPRVVTENTLRQGFAPPPADVR